MSTYRVYVLYQHQCFAIFEVASIYISIVLKISIVLEKADEHSSMVYFSVQWTLDSKINHFLFTLQGDMFLGLSFFLGILSIFYSFSFVAGRFWVHDILSFWIPSRFFINSEAKASEFVENFEYWNMHNDLGKLNSSITSWCVTRSRHVEDLYK